MKNANPFLTRILASASKPKTTTVVVKSTFLTRASKAQPSTKDTPARKT